MYLNVTIHSPVGVFVGSLNNDSRDDSDLKQLRDRIQAKPDDLNYLVIFVDDTEVLVPGDVFKNSVTEFKIQDKPVSNTLGGCVNITWAYDC